MLRIATIDDFDTVKKMASKFLEVSGYAHYSDEESIDNLIRQVLTGSPNEYICILHEDKGMIAGAVTKFPFGSKWMATEIAWWVEPDVRKSGVGKALLEAFEFWVKEKTKADMVTMVSLDEKTGDMYIREGYKLYERAYMKDL